MPICITPLGFTYFNASFNMQFDQSLVIEMSRTLIKQIIEQSLAANGMVNTAIEGVKFFRNTEQIQCSPVVYEPSITVIVSGEKQAIWNGENRVLGQDNYICCTMPTPVEAGTPKVSADNPLLGVYIPLNSKVMTELILELDNLRPTKLLPNAQLPSINTACWDDFFTDSLLRLIQLTQNKDDAPLLAKGRLRELYYAVLKGSAGLAVKQAFGVDNGIARSIALLSSNITETVSIDSLASQIGMSRAVFHRKFKQATNMSPIQFAKSIRLNQAAVMIAKGKNVNTAAMDVGYVSTSQFSREFKRMYGKSPKQWSLSKPIVEQVAK